MLVYRDRTFCINEDCKNKCFKYLTPEIEAAAKAYGLPIACCSYICVDNGETDYSVKDSSLLIKGKGFYEENTVR